MENNELLIYRDETTIHEIILAVGNSGLKWVNGSKTYIPGVGNVIISRIYLDYNNLALTGTARIIVEAESEDNPNTPPIILKSYNIDHVMITYDAKSQVDAILDNVQGYASV